MNGSAPKEILQYVPGQDNELREEVVKHVQTAEPFFTTEHATPPATQPIQDSKALQQVNAVRVGEESIISKADVKNLVDTTGAVFSGINPDTFDRTVSGNKVVSLTKGRKLRLQKAA